MKKKPSFLAFLLLAIPLLFAACSIFDPESDTAYYGVEGDGYVIFADTKKPVVGAVVTVHSTFPSHTGWGGKESIMEFYSTDSIGYYHVRFLRRADGRDVYSRYLTVSEPDTMTNSYATRWGNAIKGADWIDVSNETILTAKITVRIDTAKFF